jgi:hypothetical protein
MWFGLNSEQPAGGICILESTLSRLAKPNVKHGDHEALHFCEDWQFRSGITNADDGFIGSSRPAANIRKTAYRNGFESAHVAAKKACR